MKTVFSEKHALHDLKNELYGGEFVTPFEAPFRAEWILKAVEEAGHDDVVAPLAHDLTTAQKVHDAKYLSFLQTAWQRWKAGGFNGDAIPTTFPVRRMQQQRIPTDIKGELGYYCLASETSIGKGTWEAATAAMQVAVSGADLVNDSANPAFSLCRPPGHHASIDQYGGYCFLNNAAIAAQRFLDHGAKKVAVLDVDFHHGNGTQDIFYNRDDVYFASIHGDPVDAFPYFSGFADEAGAGAGENCNANYPLPEGTPYDIWVEALKDSLKNIRKFGAEALVVSLGVDTFENDPISYFKLKSDDFTHYGGLIAKAGLPTLFCMEGGYGVREIGLNVANVLSGFENA